MVCFGDSVTKGAPYVAAPDCFAQLLARRVNHRLQGSGRRFRCVNAGVGGENSAEGLARIESDVLTHSPDLVAVEFGLNDIRYEPEKRIPPEQFAGNLTRIVQHLRDAEAGVLLLTPNPIIDAYHGYSRNTDYYDRWGGCNGAVAEYAQVIRDVGREVGEFVCDIFQRFLDLALDAEFRGEAADHRDLTCLARYISASDGVHPTVSGHEVIARELYRYLASHAALGD
jgi:lysophospholipase L1-like esterase